MGVLSHMGGPEPGPRSHILGPRGKKTHKSALAVDWTVRPHLASEFHIPQSLDSAQLCQQNNWELSVEA